MMKNIRLSEYYVNTIKNKFQEFFKQGEIYLFGSRTDMSKKGGDIDLYLVVDDHTNLFEKS